MEFAGLKIWQAVIALLLAANSYEPTNGAAGLIGTILGSWVLVLLARTGVLWLRNRSSSSPAP